VYNTIFTSLPKKVLGIDRLFFTILRRVYILGIGNTECIFGRGNSIFRNNNRLIATKEK
jgi:hypothetical protein